MDIEKKYYIKYIYIHYKEEGMKINDQYISLYILCTSSWTLNVKMQNPIRPRELGNYVKSSNHSAVWVYYITTDLVLKNAFLTSF